MINETLIDLLCALIVGVEKEQERKVADVTEMSANELQAELTKGIVFNGLRRILIKALIVIKQGT